MKRLTLFSIALAYGSCLHAQSQANPPETQAPVISESAAKALGQLVMHATLAKQKAEFAAIAAHCTRLEAQYAAGFAARRPELERQWLSVQDRQAAVIDLMGMLISSRGENISIPDLMNRAYRVMPPPAAPVEQGRPGRIPRESPATSVATAPALPEMPAAIQESASRKATEEVKRRMEGLTWEQQRKLCDAGLVSGALPKEPEKESVPGKEPAQGM